MAKAAFVLAAGATPVLGAADSASADSGNGTDEALSDSARVANTLVGEVGSEALKTAMPVLMPHVHDATRDTAHTTSGLLGDMRGDFTSSIDDPDPSGLTLG
jgi:hypothetical protein